MNIDEKVALGKLEVDRGCPQSVSNSQAPQVVVLDLE